MSSDSSGVAHDSTAADTAGPSDAGTDSADSKSIEDGHDGGEADSKSDDSSSVPSDTMDLDGEASSCEDGWFHYIDQKCFLTKPRTPPIPCENKGDGKCYLLCTTDSDCSSTGVKCITLGLFNDGGSECNKKVQVCGPQEMHQVCL